MALGTLTLSTTDCTPLWHHWSTTDGSVGERNICPSCFFRWIPSLIVSLVALEATTDAWDAVAEPDVARASRCRCII
jgi:hypothetical protein